MKMTTIQVAQEMSRENVIELHRTIRELYELTLKEDDHFHFLFEPKGMIIRISSEISLKKVRNFLQSRGYEVAEYAYPESGDGVYNEHSDVIRLQYLLLPIFHLNSVAAIQLKDEDWQFFFERMTHTACNSKGLGYFEEAVLLQTLANGRFDLLK